MDDMIEVFGSEVGPHFWITADPVEAEKMDFLLHQYSIHTIRVPAYDFAAQGALLAHVCTQGRSQSCQAGQALASKTALSVDFEALEVGDRHATNT